MLNQSVKYIAVKKRKHFTETNIKQIQKDESLCDHTIGQWKEKKTLTKSLSVECRSNFAKLNNFKIIQNDEFIIIFLSRYSKDLCRIKKDNKVNCSSDDFSSELKNI